MCARTGRGCAQFRERCVRSPPLRPLRRTTPSAMRAMRPDAAPHQLEDVVGRIERLVVGRRQHGRDALRHPPRPARRGRREAVDRGRGALIRRSAAIPRAAPPGFASSSSSARCRRRRSAVLRFAPSTLARSASIRSVTLPATGAGRLISCPRTCARSVRAARRGSCRGTSRARSRR